VGKAARVALRLAPRAAVYNRFNDWGKSRELPAVPEQSFKEWYAKRKTEGE
jgi:L-lactate dehydrogenase complex protein LldF